MHVLTVLRGNILIRTHRMHKIVYIVVFSPSIFGRNYFVPLNNIVSMLISESERLLYSRPELYEVHTRCQVESNAPATCLCLGS